MELEINLDSFNKIYNQGDDITGNICITTSDRVIEFSSIHLSLTVRKRKFIT